MSGLELDLGGKGRGVRREECERDLLG
jgi:hypothetical protein